MLYNCEYHRVTHKFTKLFVCMKIPYVKIATHIAKLWRVYNAPVQMRFDEDN